MWLLLIFLVIPIIEIALFIQIGGLIGLWPTLGLVLLSAIVGSWLVRTQGLSELARLRSSLSDLRDPTEPLAHGAMILVAGVLLMTPGFFTDTLGLLLLLPPVRRAVLRYVRSRVTIQSFDYGTATPRRDPNIIDGEWEEVDPPRRPTHQPSGWTRH
jgi:UPF0716 protein FxsA